MTANSSRTFSFSIDRPPSAVDFDSPSVPLCLYQQLVAELEAAQATLEALERDKQELSQELENVVSYVHYLQQIIAARETEAARSPQPPQPKPIIEVESDRSRYQKPSSNNSEIDGWVLAGALILIVVTSCLGVFLIVHGRLGSHHR
jgi:hypothetical protein